MTKEQQYKISVYIDDGRVFEYFVATPDKAREQHIHAIIQTGFRNTPENSADLEWYPPRRIDKVKAEGAAESTAYRTTVRAT